MPHIAIALWRPDDRSRPSITASQIETSSVLQSVFALMRSSRLAVAHQVRVTFADGATWQAYQVTGPQGPVSLLDPLAPRAPQRYDVALWRRGTPNELPVVDACVIASSPLLAALSLMDAHKIRYARRVTVGCPDRSLWRRERLALSTEDQASSAPDEQETQEVGVTHA